MEIKTVVIDNRSSATVVKTTSDQFIGIDPIGIQTVDIGQTSDIKNIKVNQPIQTSIASPLQKQLAIDDLSDVKISIIQNGDILIYNSTTLMFENKPSSAFSLDLIDGGSY